MYHILDNIFLYYEIKIFLGSKIIYLLFDF